MKRAIITGFEPFGPYKYNPTQDMAHTLDKKRIGEFEITGLVLPCTYYGAFEMLSSKINELSPEIVLSSGLASRVPCIRLEVVGKNIMDGKYADASGIKHDNEPIIPGGKFFYHVNSNNFHLDNSLFEANIPSEISADAEGFICNSLIYLTLRRIYNENLPIRFAFFHTPWTQDYLNRINLEIGKTTIKKRDLRKTIELLVKEI